MFAYCVKLFRQNRRTLFALLFVGAFSLTVVYATPPGSPYSSGATLDPACAPGDTNCTVSLGDLWTTSGSDIYYDSGNVSIGTNTATATLTVVAGTITTTIAPPTNVTATGQYPGSGGYIAGGSTHQYRVYSYRDTLSGRIYSSSYATLSIPFQDDVSRDPYSILVSWTAATNADGYRVLKSDDYNGFAFDGGYDLTSTSFVDDNCGLVCFDDTMVDTTPTSGSISADAASFEGNVSVNNGGLTIDGSPVVSGSATAAQELAFWDSTGSITGNTKFYVNSSTGLISIGQQPTISAATGLQIGIASSLFSEYVNGSGATHANTGLASNAAWNPNGNWIRMTDNNAAGLFEINPNGDTHSLFGFFVAGDAGAAAGASIPWKYAAGIGVGRIGLIGQSNTNLIDIVTPATPNNWTLTLPTSGGTNNYVLTTNGSGVSSWSQVALTSAVTGTLPVANGGTGSGTTFTTGSIVFAGASGVYSQDNTNLFWDDTSNRLGIANASPQKTLHVGSSSVTDGTALLRLEDANSTCDFNANTGAPSCGSDRTLKKDITDLNTTDLLTKVAALTPVAYHWNTQADTDPLQYGFIAQDVQAQFPDLVHEDTWIDGSTKLFLNTGGLMPYVVGAVKELNIKVATLPILTDQTFVDRLKTFLQSIAEAGVAIVDSVKTKKVQTQELCVGDDADQVCVTKDQLRTLIQGTNSPIDGGASIPDTNPTDPQVSGVSSVGNQTPSADQGNQPVETLVDINPPVDTPAQ